METKIVARVNGVDIISMSDEQMVPIRPICELLGVDVDSQRKRIERDEILGSTAVIMQLPVMAKNVKCMPYPICMYSAGFSLLTYQE